MSNWTLDKERTLEFIKGVKDSCDFQRWEHESWIVKGIIERLESGGYDTHSPVDDEKLYAWICNQKNILVKCLETAAPEMAGKLYAQADMLNLFLEAFTEGDFA